jgi:hypothetical protein
MNAFAHLLMVVSGMIHGGGLVAFALLLNFRHAMKYVRDEDVVRVYRGFGAGFGLSLGALVFSSAWLFAQTVNPGKGLPDAFAPPWDDPLTLVRLGTFFALWVSYTVLEVWTLEPCRQLDKGTIADPAAYATATNRVARHLAFNATLFTIAAALGALGAKP